MLCYKVLIVMCFFPHFLFKNLLYSTVLPHYICCSTLSNETMLTTRPTSFTVYWVEWLDSIFLKKSSRSKIYFQGPQFVTEFKGAEKIMIISPIEAKMYSCFWSMKFAFHEILIQYWTEQIWILWLKVLSFLNWCKQIHISLNYL